MTDLRRHFVVTLSSISGRVKKIKVPKQKNQKENNYIVVKKKKVFGNTFDTLKRSNSLQVNQHFATFVQHLNSTPKKEI